MRFTAFSKGLVTCLLLAAGIGQANTVSAVPVATGRVRMVDGQEALKRVTQLTTEISWYTSLDYAMKIAQAQNKPIFWMHMLGPLNGKT